MSENEETKTVAIEDRIMTTLGEVIDPELGIDLVNLGLIYRIEMVGSYCRIYMTLTTMGCPLGNVLADQISDAVTTVDGVTGCEIHLVWEPAWDIDKMSRYAKVALGLHG